MNNSSTSITTPSIAVNGDYWLHLPNTVVMRFGESEIKSKPQVNGYTISQIFEIDQRNAFAVLEMELYPSEINLGKYILYKSLGPTLVLNVTDPKTGQIYTSVPCAISNDPEFKLQADGSGMIRFEGSRFV